MTDNCKVRPFAEINFPNPTQPGRVFGYMPSATTGQLCRAYGTVSPPTGYYVAQIYVKNFNIADTPTKANILAGSQYTQQNSDNTANAPFPWSAPLTGSGPSSISGVNRSPVTPTGNPIVTNNKLGITALFLQTGGSGFQYLDPPAVVQYKGDALPCLSAKVADERDQPISDCTTASQHALPLFGQNGPSIALGCRGLSANCTPACQSDWINFEGLSVSNQLGNVLQLDCQSFRASTIAVYARHVCWKMKPTSCHIIHRANGSSFEYDDFSFLPFAFNELAPGSIVIYQPSTGFTHVVNSQCADHPDIVSLNPNYDVFVTVNDRIFGSYSDNVGSFSLSISVLGSGTASACPSCRQ